MFALTHLYCGAEINPRADNLFLYGAVFPDIPVLGIIDWDLMKNKTLEFSQFVKSRGKLNSFAQGLLVHEEPYGIDRFVHGSNGYAFSKGKILHKYLKDYFPKENISTVAHGFIEFAVEMKMASKFPELENKIKKVQKVADKNILQVSSVFADFFNLPKVKTRKTVEKYNKLLVYDISTREKAIKLYIELLKTLRASLMPQEKVEQLLDLSLGATTDYFIFLEEIIKKCKKDFV